MKCDICDATVPVLIFKVYRHENQARPDFTLTICKNCLPRFYAKLEERAKREAWTSETWNK